MDQIARENGYFNPRAPYGARPRDVSPAWADGNFNPRAPYGARLAMQSILHGGILLFQSTRPIRGATGLPVSVVGSRSTFQSTRPIRGATLPDQIRMEVSEISIHAPHTGRDTMWRSGTSRATNFNPRAPYGARPCDWRRRLLRTAISIHAPHTGRDGQRRGQHDDERVISIHAPHTGRDLPCTVSMDIVRRFQSTRPIRGATRITASALRSSRISIHAPHTGRDKNSRFRSSGSALFQSTRPIRGATFRFGLISPGSTSFQSTRPIRGATSFSRPTIPLGQISIHAPHTGRDVTARMSMLERRLFQSTRPIRGATQRYSTGHSPLDHFNPRAPYGARQCFHFRTLINAVYFNPRAPYGARQQSTGNAEDQQTNFNPRAPYGARRPPVARPFCRRSDFNPRAPYGARLLIRAYTNNNFQFQSTRPIRGATVLPVM